MKDSAAGVRFKSDKHIRWKQYLKNLLVPFSLRCCFRGHMWSVAPKPKVRHWRIYGHRFQTDEYFSVNFQNIIMNSRNNKYVSCPHSFPSSTWHAYKSLETRFFVLQTIFIFFFFYAKSDVVCVMQWSFNMFDVPWLCCLPVVWIWRCIHSFVIRLNFKTHFTATFKLADVWRNGQITRLKNMLLCQKYYKFTSCFFRSFGTVIFCEPASWPETCRSW